MSDQGIPTLLQEEEEVLGDPSFELLVRDGRPIVSGSYFIHPPLRAISAEWDGSQPDRILVRANDGTDWIGEKVALKGTTNVPLHPANGSHPAYTGKELP
jgi:hypothetical protein